MIQTSFCTEAKLMACFSIKQRCSREMSWQVMKPLAWERDTEQSFTGHPPDITLFSTVREEIVVLWMCSVTCRGSAVFCCGVLRCY